MRKLPLTQHGKFWRPSPDLATSTSTTFALLPQRGLILDSSHSSNLFPCSEARLARLHLLPVDKATRVTCNSDTARCYTLRTVANLHHTSKGTILNESGIDASLISKIADLKVSRKALIDLSAGEHKFTYKDGVRPWKEVGKVDVALPSATQNEVSGDEAEALVNAGAKFIAEGSNMGCTQEAIDHFEKVRKEKKGDAIWYAPGKAANAGGVAVSGLEMAQNSQRLKWTSEEVDEKLKGIMKNCFENCLEMAKEYVTPADGEFPSLVAGANVAGFLKVAAAMKAQGDWF